MKKNNNNIGIVRPLKLRVMKKALLATIVAYIVAMIAMFFGVQEYIKNKDNRLRNEIHEKINAIFANKNQFVDIAYSGYKVGCEKAPIPSKPVDSFVQTEEMKKLIGDIHRQRMDEWKEKYGDLYKLYLVMEV